MRNIKDANSHPYCILLGFVSNWSTYMVRRHQVASAAILSAPSLQEEEQEEQE